MAEIVNFVKEPVVNKESEIRELKAILSIIEGMVSGSSLNTSVGICCNIGIPLALDFRSSYRFKDTFKGFIKHNRHSTWYSGDYTFPIINLDTPDIDANRAFIQADIKGTLWSGTYGETRCLVLVQYRRYLEKRLEALTRKSMWQRLKDWLRKT